MQKLISVIAAISISVSANNNAFAQMRYLSMGAYKISSINPITMEGVLSLRVRNDTIAFTMDDVSGTLYKNGEYFMFGTTKNIYIPSGESKVKIYGHVEKYDGISFLEILKSLLSFAIDDYKADISLKVRFSSGEVENKERKGIELKDFRSINKTH